MSRRLYKKYIPMTETAYYILLALKKERHGYGILGWVQERTNDRLKLGAGTIYGTLSKMDNDGLIEAVSETDRRKTYIITPLGLNIMQTELSRLEELLFNGRAEVSKA